MASGPKPHAVLFPQPAQGHVTPMIQLAKFLHSRGFRITFVHSEYNRRRHLQSHGPDSLRGWDGFRFESVPDGLPAGDRDDVTQDIAQLCVSMAENCGGPFRDLLKRLDDSRTGLRVSCVIADGVMSFAQRAAEELGIRALLFQTTSACGFMGYFHFAQLITRGYTPLKDESYLTNGYLDTRIDWIPGMDGIRLKDIPSFIRTTNRDDVMLNFDGGEAQNALKARGVILNTYDELEHEVLTALNRIFPNIYTIGPLSKFVDQIRDDDPLKSFGSSLWKEDLHCLQWLDTQKLGAVLYVNFGSITVMTAEQLREFAWGIAGSGHSFLWAIRPDLIGGNADVILPDGFMEEIQERGVLVRWCPQERLLSHRAVGGFLTHNGWNSTLESICGGVPMICWPFFAEQPTNCRYACRKWGIGMEIGGEVRREEVKGLVKELMEGEKGREMRLKAKEWKERAECAVEQGGTSYKNMERLVDDLAE